LLREATFVHANQLAAVTREHLAGRALLPAGWLSWASHYELAAPQP
jgi:hypothetical protein